MTVSLVVQRLAERKKAIVASTPALVTLVIYVLTGYDVDPALVLSVIGIVSAVVVHQTQNHS